MTKKQIIETIELMEKAAFEDLRTYAQKIENAADPDFIKFLGRWEALAELVAEVSK